MQTEGDGLDKSQPQYQAKWDAAGAVKLSLETFEAHEGFLGLTSPSFV